MNRIIFIVFNDSVLELGNGMKDEQIKSLV